MSKALPRLTRNARRPNADEVVRPIPPTLAKLVSGEDAARQHDLLAERYGETRTKIAALAAAHEKALADDDAERRAALVAGRAAKAPKAEKAERELEQARGDLELLAEMLGSSAAEVLRASIPFVRQAIADVDERQERALDEADSMLTAASAAFDEAARVAAEAGWLAQLAESGQVHPFRGEGSPVVWRAHEETRGALRRLVEEREERVRRVEQMRREREAADTVRIAGETQATRLRPVPGQEVWSLDDAARAVENAA